MPHDHISDHDPITAYPTVNCPNCGEWIYEGQPCLYCNTYDPIRIEIARYEAKNSRKAKIWLHISWGIAVAGMALIAVFIVLMIKK